MQATLTVLALFVGAALAGSLYGKKEGRSEIVILKESPGWVGPVEYKGSSQTGEYLLASSHEGYENRGHEGRGENEEGHGLNAEGLRGEGNGRGYNENGHRSGNEEEVVLIENENHGELRGNGRGEYNEEGRGGYQNNGREKVEVVEVENVGGRHTSNDGIYGERKLIKYKHTLRALA